MTKMKKISWATLTALSIVLAACGNDDNDSSAPGPAATGSVNSWSQVTFLTDCDRGPAATPTDPNAPANPTSPDTVPLPAPSDPAAPNRGNETGTTTNTNTSTETAPNDINALNESMQRGNLRCTGSGGRNFSVSRDGQYTMPDGSTGTLAAAQLEQVRSIADGLFREGANRNVACENSAEVRDDEALHANDGAGQMRVLYSADRQDRRRCFLGDRAEIERLRQAVQPLADRYRAMGEPASPARPTEPANPSDSSNPSDPSNPSDSNQPANPGGNGGAGV